ncbi:MAG: hypothetical protein IKR98_00700 [Bacteroidaceae bacterium]|nr:hypothetical protein [Bacteroidaceae bacterium]
MTKDELIDVVNDTFNILRSNSSRSRILFPAYRDNERRVSEQELRFVFVEQLQKLLEKYDLFYSVETPTHGKYKFTENRKNIDPRVDKNGQSANFDLTIVDKNGNTIAIIEFKAKMATQHEYDKDFCKLFNPKESSSYRLFINLFEKIETETKSKFLEKIERCKSHYKNSSNIDVIVMAQSLREGDSFINEIY